MSSREFARWVAYHSISPIGPERDDLRAGKLAMEVAAALGGLGGRKLKDFVLDFEPPKPKSADELTAALRGALGAKPTTDSSQQAGVSRQ